MSISFEERARRIHERLLEIAEKEINDEKIRSITVELLREPKITFVRVEPRISFYESPAAPKNHHSYPGGLLDHTLGVTEIAMQLIKVYRDVYGATVNKDIVVAAALLHDLFKYYQYEKDPLTGGYRPRSDWYLSHEFAMVSELYKRGAPDPLVRAIAEAHGTTPFTMVESQIVHQADSTDSQFVSKLQDVVWRACLDLELEVEGVRAIKIFHEAMKRAPIFEYAKVYYSQGRDGLREYIKKLLGLAP
nr:HD domain-containing protein [Pyrolobus fumarii]